jgi:phosphopantothenoylcysteine decarboxylase
MLQMIHHGHDGHNTSMANTPPPFSSAAFAHDGKHHLLLAASGSVATIKLPNILTSLSTHPNLSIRLILTSSATNFLKGQAVEQPALDSLHRIKNVDGIFLDEEEWVTPWKRGNEILHIELRRWAHVLVIAPLSANTLAKIVGGFSDNLLTSVVRAWDTTGTIDPFPAAADAAVTSGNGEVSASKGRKKRIIVAPAMNTAMWRHPITKSQIRVLDEDWGVCKSKGKGEGHVSIAGDGDCEDESEREGWFEVLRPMEKELACGDVGTGAMKDWREIVGVIEERLGL